MPTGGGKTARKEGNMNTLREYNVMREPWLTLEEQKKRICAYWGDRIVKRPTLLKENKNYITFTVRI